MRITKERLDEIWIWLNSGGDLRSGFSAVRDLLTEIDAMKQGEIDLGHTYKMALSQYMKLSESHKELEREIVELKATIDFYMDNYLELASQLGKGTKKDG